MSRASDVPGWAAGLSSGSQISPTALLGGAAASAIRGRLADLQVTHRCDDDTELAQALARTACDETPVDDLAPSTAWVFVWLEQLEEEMVRRWVLSASLEVGYRLGRDLLGTLDQPLRELPTEMTDDAATLMMWAVTNPGSWQLMRELPTAVVEARDVAIDRLLGGAERAPHPSGAVDATSARRESTVGFGVRTGLVLAVVEHELLSL